VGRWEDWGRFGARGPTKFLVFRGEIFMVLDQEPNGDPLRTARAIRNLAPVVSLKTTTETMMIRCPRAIAGRACRPAVARNKVELLFFAYGLKAGNAYQL